MNPRFMEPADYTYIGEAGDACMCECGVPACWLDPCRPTGHRWVGFPHFRCVPAESYDSPELPDVDVSRFISRDVPLDRQVGSFVSAFRDVAETYSMAIGFVAGFFGSLGAQFLYHKLLKDPPRLVIYEWFKGLITGDDG